MEEELLLLFTGARMGCFVLTPNLQAGENGAFEELTP